MVGVWVLIMSAVACLWNGIGISLNWMFLFAGVIYTGAVGPIVLTVLWRKQTAAAAISGAIGGMFVGITCWLVVAKTHYGVLDLTSTGEQRAFPPDARGTTHTYACQARAIRRWPGTSARSARAL